MKKRAMRHRARPIRRVVAPLALTACTLGAHAQTAMVAAPAGAASSPPPNQLETVTVSAERRTVDLQKAPLAVTAITGATLDKSNIFDLSGLNGTVPGLTISKSSGYERAVTIRGIGTETPENAYTTQPGVSLHIDGVYIANTISIDQSLFDLDHIEVLRGPQGTLFGQSSTGGTINLVTRQPVLGSLSGAGDVSVGNYGLHRERAELNTPLGSDWALRTSVQEYGHTGFATATGIAGGYKLDDANDHSLKAAVLYRPGADVTATLTGQWYRANQHGAAQKNVDDPDPDPRRVSQDYPALFQLQSDLYHLNVDWSLPWATLKSITAYQELHHKQQEDDDRLTDAILRPQNLGYTYDDIAAWNTNLKNFTQEFDLASKPGGPVDWIVGAFFMKQKSNQYVIEYAGTETNPVLTIPADIKVTQPDNLEYGEDVTAHRTSYSLFFQSTYHATDALRLTAGARYNHDRYDTYGSGFAGAIGGGPSPWKPNHREYADHKPTGKIEADYDLTPDSLVYASVTRGYKPGGLNGSNTAVVVPQRFQPETVVSYEVGSKNKLLDNTLRLNAAAFYYTYRDQQYIEVDPIPFAYGINNIPKTDIWGGELEASYLTLASRLRFDGNVTVMSGKFKGHTKTIDATIANQVIANNPACAFGIPPSYAGPYGQPDCWTAIIDAGRDLNGNRPAKLPRLQGSISSSYAAAVPYGTLTPRLEFVYRGDFNYRVFNESGLDHVPSYSIWNLNLEFQPDNSAWTVSLSGSNLLNKAGVNSRYTDPYGTGSTSQEYIAPRQIIGTVAYTF